MPTSLTLYLKVKNLEESIKIPALVESLREIFSEYGTVIDIVAKKSLKRKGQAFIVFDSVESAQGAIDEINGFELFDKPMHLDFARTQSDAIVKRSGTEQDLEQHKRHRLAEKGTETMFDSLVLILLTLRDRTQASHRSRGREEPQASRSCRARSSTARSQSSSWGWSQARRWCCRWCRSGRVLAAK